MQNETKKDQKYPVRPMNISINMEKTGAHIKRLIQESGYTRQEIMAFTGITTEQTIYKWYSGKSLPSLETQIILCKLLGLRVTELLVIDGELPVSGEKERNPDSITRGKEETQISHSGEKNVPPILIHLDMSDKAPWTQSAEQHCRRLRIYQDLLSRYLKVHPEDRTLH